MENTVKERIKKFINYKKISVRKFEKMCNLSNGYINGINQTIMPNKASAINLQFPDLNMGWVLAGQGEMLLSEAEMFKRNTTMLHPQNESDYSLKSLVWMVFSLYKNKNGVDFSFDSFVRISNVFKLAAEFTSLLQSSLEKELSLNADGNIFPNYKDNFTMLESLTVYLDKYADIYKKLDLVSLNITEIINSLEKEEKFERFINDWLKYVFSIENKP